MHTPATPAMTPLPPLPTPWPYPRWIAHRGAGRLAPENTLAAFRRGAQHGYRAFECDVKLSADGVCYLLHDDTLERTTSARGGASTLPWAALAALDAGGWHSATHAGEPPASLAAVAAFCLANGHALNLEIKPSPGADAETGRVVATQVRALWGAAVAAGRSAWPLLSSFSPTALAAAQAQDAELPRALLLEALHPDDLATARTLTCQAVVFDHTLLDAARVQQWHAAGLRVLAYTVNQPARAQLLLDWGLDGLITDAVNTLPVDRQALQASPI